MPQSDNMYYYVVYGIILVAFFVVLRSPKKDKSKSKQKDQKKNRGDHK